MNKIVKSVMVAGVLGGIAVAYCNRDKISKAIVDAKKEVEHKREEQLKAIEDIFVDELAKAFGADPTTFRAYGAPQSGKSTGCYDKFLAKEFANPANKTSADDYPSNGKGV